MINRKKQDSISRNGRLQEIAEGISGSGRREEIKPG
jgi:hypothetical protein